ncbi:MAG: TIGR00153 family protein [Candidatus Methanofastidiosa archaeon]|nr:TIGR00153 family protein [Candidatus Methanofastidiosa archaeon]
MLFGKKEDEVSQLLEQHVALVQKCLDHFKEGFESYLNDNLPSCEEVREKILKHEHEADEVRREIQMKLYEGAFMPLYRDDIYRFVDMLDNVADEAKHLTDGFFLERPMIPKDLSDDFFQLLKESISPFEDLKIALQVFRDDKEKALAATLEVEKKESKVDKMEHDLRYKIFNHKKIELSQKLHMRNLSLHLAKISDIIEECSDIIEIMLVKRQL